MEDKVLNQKKCYISILQGCYGIINLQTAKNILGFYTEEIRTCYIISIKKSDGTILFAHVDGGNNLDSIKEEFKNKENEIKIFYNKWKNDENHIGEICCHLNKYGLKMENNIFNISKEHVYLNKDGTISVTKNNIKIIKQEQFKYINNIRNLTISKEIEGFNLLHLQFNSNDFCEFNSENFQSIKEFISDCGRKMLKRTQIKIDGLLVNYKLKIIMTSNYNIDNNTFNLILKNVAEYIKILQKLENSKDKELVNKKEESKNIKKQKKSGGLFSGNFAKNLKRKGKQSDKEKSIFS